MSKNPEEKFHPPSAKTINRGILCFTLFTLFGLIFIIWWKTPEGVTHLLRHLNVSAFILFIPLLGIDYVIGGFRYSLFFDGKILPKISLWDCIRSNWTNIFMGAVTPFQTGGGPAQLYILWRKGATISQGILVSLINFASTLFFFQIASIAAILILPSNLFGQNLMNLIRTGFAIIFGLTALIITILVFPNIGYKLIKLLFSMLPLRFFRLYNLRNRLLDILSMEIQHFGELFRNILSKRKYYLLIILLATIVLFFNKYIIGYVIAISLTSGIDFNTFIGLQIIQYFLIYFAPTPGASGLAEISSAWLMQTIMSTQVLVFFAIIYRFLTTILGAIIGGGVLLLDLRKWLKSSQLKSPEKPAVQNSQSLNIEKKTLINED